MTIPIIQNSLRRSAGRRVSLAIRYVTRPLTSHSSLYLCPFHSREDPDRIWERRAPLTPDAVYHLVSKHNVDVQVMPCHRRVFPNQEYEKVCVQLYAYGINLPLFLHRYLPALAPFKCPNLFPSFHPNGIANSPTHFLRPEPV